MEKEYFRFHITEKIAQEMGNNPNHTEIIAGNLEDIEKTFKYYQDKRGKNIWFSNLDKIKPIGRKLEIVCSKFPDPTINPEYCIKLSIAENLDFRIYAIVFNYVKDFSENPKRWLRGATYKFFPGNNEHGLWFLSQEVVDKMKSYDWNKDKQMLEVLERRRDLLETARILGFSNVPKMK